MKNRTYFQQQMQGLSEIFDKSLSETVISVYWQALEPFTDEECEQAFKKAALTGKFFPKPAELIEHMAVKSEDRALLAWTTVVDTIRSVGPYRSVEFDDSTIHAVIFFMGGWPAAGDWLEDELKWKQKEFERLYKIMAGRTGDTRKYLPGIHENSNGERWKQHNPPLAIIGGEKQKQLTS